MDAHFAAFSFVDRITAFEAAQRARGEFAVPTRLSEFPASLVAEAIGQLAAWVAMAHIGFRARPVAALARETRFRHAAQPGDLLKLAVEIEQCDEEAVAYHGRAEARGQVLVELVDCLGPMLPAADFDDPDALRVRLALLRDGGAPPGRFQGVALPALVRTGGEAGKSATARFDVPGEAPFFADHFPRRPVFPATLLLHTEIGLARQLAAEAGSGFVPASMSNVKVRSFTPPGATLELNAEIVSSQASEMRIALSARAEGRNVATARLALAPEGPSP